MTDLISRVLARRTVRSAKPTHERTWKQLSPLLRLLILTQLTFNIGFFAVLPFLAEHLGTALGMAGWMVGFVLACGPSASRASSCSAAHSSTATACARSC